MQSTRVERLRGSGDWWQTRLISSIWNLRTCKYMLQDINESTSWSDTRSSPVAWLGWFWIKYCSKDHVGNSLSRAQRWGWHERWHRFRYRWYLSWWNCKGHIKISKPLESLEGGTVLGLQLDKNRAAKLVFTKGNEISEVHEEISRRELFSRDKLVGHSPIGGWLKSTCSYMKRKATELAGKTGWMVRRSLLC